jgi:hypothetical protein
MQHILIRVAAENFGHWLSHYLALTEARREFGLSDGPIYRDTGDPNIALVHLLTANLPRALEWFRDPRFQKAAVNANVIGREFYVTEKQ